VGYYIDLSVISIDEYMRKLKKADLVPSRMVLKEEVESRFKKLEKQGISNLEELQKALKKKDELKEFALKADISEDYLVILVREINSINPKPNKIKDFIGISPDIAIKLEEIGVKNTPRLYDKVISIQKRKELADKIGISESVMLELTKLTDLSRIKWVGETFARMLYDVGYDTAEKFANSDYEEAYEKIKKLNNEKKYFKGNIGKHDIKVCVEAAQDVNFEIEY